MGSGTYPRATYINDNSLLGCFRSYKNDKLALEAVRSTDKGKTWSPVGTAITVEKKKNQRDPTDDHYVKHYILVYSSDDAGKNWKPSSTVATTETTGLGLWEPFLMDGLSGDLMLVFSRETRIDGKDQNNVVVRSTDGGKTWSKEVTISGGEIQKRDGMVGVARVTPGSKKLVAVFESLLDNTGITSVTSEDDGKTWGNRRLVYQGTNGPPSETAPQIVRVGEKTLVVSFSTKEDNRENRHVQVVVSTDGGATWGQKTLVHKNCHWAGEVAVDGNRLLVMCDHNDGTSVSMRVSIH